MSEIEIHCKHSKQIALLAKIIRHSGWRSLIVVSKRSGFIVSGHGRLEAAKLLNVQTVPIDVQDFKTEAEEFAHLVADNRIAELAEMSDNKLTELLSVLSETDIDMDVTGFDHDALDGLLKQFHVDEGELPTLPEGDGSGFRQVTFTITDSQSVEVENAMHAAKSLAPFGDTGNENSNGNSLARIAESYTSGKSKTDNN